MFVVLCGMSPRSCDSSEHCWELEMRRIALHSCRQRKGVLLRSSRSHDCAHARSTVPIFMQYSTVGARHGSQGEALPTK